MDSGLSSNLIRSIVPNRGLSKNENGIENNVNPDEWLIMRHLIKIYTVFKGTDSVCRLKRLHAKNNIFD